LGKVKVIEAFHTASLSRKGGKRGVESKKKRVGSDEIPQGAREALWDGLKENSISSQGDFTKRQEAKVPRKGSPFGDGKKRKK